MKKGCYLAALSSRQYMFWIEKMNGNYAIDSNGTEYFVSEESYEGVPDKIEEVVFYAFGTPDPVDKLQKLNWKFISDKDLSTRFDVYCPRYKLKPLGVK